MLKRSMRVPHDLYSYLSLSMFSQTQLQLKNVDKKACAERCRWRRKLRTQISRRFVETLRLIYIKAVSNSNMILQPGKYNASRL
jgi:hypothetical protein